VFCNRIEGLCLATQKTDMVGDFHPRIGFQTALRERATAWVQGK
jgi:hypothetical protein